MNLSNLATGQLAAVSTRRWPQKQPLAEIVKAELPAKKAEGRIIEEKKEFETGLTQEKELFEKDLEQREAQSLTEITQEQKQHEENLAEMAREHTATMTQRKNELGIAARQAEKAEGVQAIGMGLTAGKLFSEMEGMEGYAPAAMGFGIGYGVSKYSGKKKYGAAAGAAAGAGIAWLQDADAATTAISSIAGFLGGMI